MLSIMNILCVTAWLKQQKPYPVCTTLIAEQRLRLHPLMS